MGCRREPSPPPHPADPAALGRGIPCYTDLEVAESDTLVVRVFDAQKDGTQGISRIAFRIFSYGSRAFKELATCSFRRSPCGQSEDRNMPDRASHGAHRRLCKAFSVVGVVKAQILYREQHDPLLSRPRI